MAPNDKGKDLGYHWRRAAGVYDDPNRPKDQAPGNASTISDKVSGLGASAPKEKS
jgi:hypothetical protein